MSWLDRLLEASEDQVDDVIDAAMSGDAEGIGDSNLAGAEVKDSDVSNDPDKLVYDKTDCYSQSVDQDEVKADGTVDVDLGDTDTSVGSGSETAAAEAALTADELRMCYTESVAKVMLQEATKAQINAEYKKTVADAKAKKAKAIDKAKAAKKAKKVSEAANVAGMLDDIFSKF